MMMAGLMASHFLLALGFGMSSLGAILRVLGLIVTLTSLIVYGMRWRRGNSCVVQLREDGTAALVDDFQQPREIRIGPGTRDLGWAVWLECVTSDGGDGGFLTRRQFRLCSRDAVDEESWRVLRIWLRYCVARTLSGETVAES